MEMMKLVSTTRSGTFGGEGAVRSGGKLDLPGVCRTLATGGAPLDVPERRQAAARRPGAGEDNVESRDVPNSHSICNLLSAAQLLQGDEEHFLLLRRGLLLHRLLLSDSGVYTCTGHQLSFSHSLARYRVHVLASDILRPGRRLQPDLSPLLSADRKSWGLPQQLPAKSYKSRVGAGGQNRDEYCEQLWQREKRRQQKLRTLKQEIRKARVRRNDPPEHGGHGGWTRGSGMFLHV